MKALLKEPSLEKKLREERRNFGKKRKLASKMKNKIILAFASIFLVLVLTVFVSAWGVSSPYWDKGASEPSSLDIYLGETKTVDLNIQNMAGNEDIVVKAEIKKGAEIASLEKDTYSIKLGTSENALLKITAPLTIGTYKVEVEFKTITSGGTGGVAMGTGYTISFDVMVSEKPRAAGALIWVILIAVVIAIAVVIYLIIKRKNKVK